MTLLEFTDRCKAVEGMVFSPATNEEITAAKEALLALDVPQDWKDGARYVIGMTMEARHPAHLKSARVDKSLPDPELEPLPTR